MAEDLPVSSDLERLLKFVTCRSIIDGLKGRIGSEPGVAKRSKQPFGAIFRAATG
jgi:hypothetical protein